MTARAFVWSVWWVIGVASACGGASDTGLFGGNDSANDGGTHDAGGDAASPDAAPPNVVQCAGTDGCKVGSQACCRKNGAFSCTSINGCNGGNALAIPCDKQRDCGAGNVCCLLADAQGIATQVACRTAADCATQLRSAQLCDPNAAGTCGTTASCLPSTSALPGYDICR